MRRLVLFLAATAAAAEDDKELAAIVEALVKDLGAPEAEVRTLAVFRLAAYGDRIRPLLEQVVSDDPEVRRSLRYLVRSVGKVQLDLLPPPQNAIPIGAALTLEVRIVNNTDESIQLLPDAARNGVAGPFRIRVAGKTLSPVRFDQVDWGGETPAIAAGASRRFRLNLGGDTSPLRRPALYDVSVVFKGAVARGDVVEDFGNGADLQVFDATEELELESAPVRIHVLGRKADDLDQALGSADPREKEAAAKELSMRDDDAVVPILRKRALERPLRLAAIRRLAALGAEEDYGLLFDATRDESADVRRVAVLGLGKYGEVPALATKARNRLLLLAADHELQLDAIRALRGHKHVATVECYVKLLRSGRLSSPSVQSIRLTLLEWTGLAVDQRKSEIDAFVGWWETNRKGWAEETAAKGR